MIKKILAYDLETIPFFAHPDPLISKNDFLKSEYDRYYEIEQKKGKTDIFLSSPLFNIIIAIGWLIGKWDETQNNWIIDTNEKTNKEKIGAQGGNDEKKILEKFIKYINTNELEHFISFNGHRFDIPLLFLRSIFHNIPITNKKFKYRNKYSLINHFDVFLALSHFQTFPLNLRTAANLVGSNDPKTNNSGKDVVDLFKKGEIKSIMEYCKTDVLTTFKIFQKIWKYYI